MSLPEPVPGLVINYAYLWHGEAADGREEGKKHRPCAVIAALRRENDGATRALVLPITHLAPGPADVAVQIPASVKARLGLDEEPSWIVLSEWNDFVWPGPDLRRVPGQATFAYGMLPPRLFRTLQARFIDLAKKGTAGRVSRD